MKKTIKAIVAISISFMLIGCGNDQMSAPSTDGVANLHIESTGTFEWVSPDGVHYWVYHGGYTYGIAPRYDCNGDLVISGK